MSLIFLLWHFYVSYPENFELLMGAILITIYKLTITTTDITCTPTNTNTHPHNNPHLPTHSHTHTLPLRKYL